MNNMNNKSEFSRRDRDVIRYKYEREKIRIMSKLAEDYSCSLKEIRNLLSDSDPNPNPSSNPDSDPDLNPNPDLNRNDTHYFWDSVDVSTPDKCWEWMAGTNLDGYGQFDFHRNFYGRLLPAERVAWRLTYGIVPYGKHVFQSCGNPACCNPLHLGLTDNPDYKGGKRK